MERTDGIGLVTKEALLAVGCKWEGTFAEAGDGGIRAVQADLKSRLNEIRHKRHPDLLLGLSAHHGGDRFTHYAVVEVAVAENVPDGMTTVAVPSAEYARCRHERGQRIDVSYSRVYEWIESNGLRPSTGGITHLEEYPMAQDSYDPDPEFVILIPIDRR